MNQKVVYSLMALSAMPGAMQAAVGVQTGTAIVSTNNEVEVNFGTLVPGKYLFTAVVTQGNVTSATFGGVQARISGVTITANLELTEATAVTFVASSNSQFTMGAYELTLDWEPDATALNALYEQVYNNIQGYNANLTEAHQQGLASSLQAAKAKIEEIEALADDAAKYDAYQNYKLYNEKDDITLELESIQATAEQNYIDDCWATKQAAYNNFLTAYNQVSLTALQTKINALTDTKAKRQTALEAIQNELVAFKAGADAALGQKAENVEDATPVFEYEPDPTLDEINGEIDALDQLVEQDKTNATNFATLQTNQTAAVYALETLQTKIAAQKNAAQKEANATTATDYGTQLTDYLAEAQDNYDAAAANDGVFDYDLQFATLNGITEAIAALSQTVDEQNTAYDGTNTTIQGYFTAALLNYETQLAAVTEAITETAYVDILETAQSDLLAKKNEITALQATYTTAYENGGNLDAATAEGEVNEINQAMEGIATDAIAEAAGYREIYNSFVAQIAEQKARLTAIMETEGYEDVADILGEQINAQNELLEEIEANLALANKANAQGVHEIGTPGYAPTAYDGTTTIAAVTAAIDDMNVDQIIDELGAYTTALADIQDVRETMDAAKANVTSYGSQQGVINKGYDVEEAWDAAVSDLAGLLDGLEASITEKYGDGTTTQVQDYTATLATELGEINTAINNFKADARSAIQKYKDFYNNIWGTSNATISRLQSLTSRVQGKAVYDDVTYIFNNITGDNKANFQTRIAEIQSKIDQAESDRVAALNLTGAAHYTAVKALNYSNYKIAKVIVELPDGTKPVNLTNQSLNNACDKLTANVITQAQNAYDEAVAETVVDAIAATFADAQAAVKEAITASKAENTVGVDLGIATDDIVNAFDGLFNEADGLGLANSDNTALLKVRKYNQLLEQIGNPNDEASSANNATLYARLKALEAQAVAAAQAKVADDAAQAALAESMGALAQERTDAEDYVTTNCADVPNSYDFGVIDAAIEALETAIANAATAQNTVANQNDFDEEIARISGLIVAEQAKADKAQAKYTANVTLTAKYNEVNTYLGEQRALVGAVAGNAPDEFDQAAIQTYKDEFNGDGGFVERLAGIKSEIQAKLASDEEASEYLEDLLQQLDALKVEIGNVLPAATANYTSYQTQMEAYTASLEVYTENNATLNDATVYPEQDSEVITQAKEDMAAQKDELDAALATIQNQYGAGEAVDNENTNIATVGEISAAIEAIIVTLDGGTYAEAISAQNAQTYSDDILPALQTIQDAYVAAVAVLDDYQGAQNADIRALVEQESADLNNAVFEAPQTKSNFAARATQEQNDANVAGTLWDTAQILADIEAYVEELNQTKADFADAIEGAIVNYWDGEKATRQNYIGSIFNTLTARGYNAGDEPQTAEEIFANQYNWIAQGDAIVNPEGEDAIISIAALDNLLATDGFSTATYQNNVKATACALANTEVTAMLDPYINATTGKKVTDLAEINEIIAAGYDLPDGATPIEDQFDNLVGNNLTWADNQRANRLNSNSLYSYNKQNFQNRLNWYDNGVEQLKATATEWAQNRADRLEAIATLTDNCVTANATIDAAVALINQTSVAANYEDAIAGIYELIAQPDNEWTMADVEEAEANLAQIDGALAILNDNVVAAVLEKAGTKVAGLKADFNQYAASESADETIVNELSNRIHAVEAAIANGTDIEGAVALETEVAKLQTELEILNNAQFAADIEEYENRAADLQAATLPEADYGNMADEFAERLAAINAAGEAIGADITAHVEAGDIMPYVASIVSRLEEQEAALEALEGEAEAQAQKVAANQATVAALNERVNALLAAELTGEYGPYANNVAQRLAIIQNQAATLAGNIETNAENIEWYQDQYENTLAQLEEQLAQLQEDAAGYADEWAAQQATSTAVYAVLLEQFNAINAEIQGYIAAAGAYTNGYTYNLDYIQYELAESKAQFDYENENNSLDEDDQANYTDQMEQIQGWAQAEMNYQAYREANALYNYNNCDLRTARNDAWTAWNNWSFAATLKATLQQELWGYDAEAQDLVTLISDDYNDGNSYANMATYAQTAATIIAKYNAIVERMASFKPFGDATGDGKVNVLDYQKVANMILDPTLQPAADSDLFLVTDVNQNQAIEVGDLTGIVNIIMGREWDQAAARAANADGESLTTTTSQTQVGTQRIYINLQNVNEYTAFQLDIVLPEGMTIVGKDLTDRAGDTHNLWSRNQQDGSVRFLASSVKGETFKGNSGAVLYIDVETNSDYMGGDVQLLNILFSDVTSATHVFTVGNSEATGINSMLMGDSLKEKVYNIGGKLMNGLKKGVNIIRRADGTTEKKMVK